MKGLYESSGKVRSKDVAILLEKRATDETSVRSRVPRLFLALERSTE